MLKFTLSNFYDCQILNDFLFTISKSHSNWFKINLSFSAIKGSFPFLSWNGGLNNSFGDSRYKDFIRKSNDSILNLRLDFSNVLLNEHDFYDRKANLILKVFEDTSLEIEISNLKLYEFLHEKYPNYYFIFSKKADLITPFTPELLNFIVNEEKFKLISLPDRVLKDDDFLKQLEKPNKFELTVNPKCFFYGCQAYNECQVKENELQLEFSGSSCAFCQNRPSYWDSNLDLSLEQINEKYGRKGFINWCFEDINSVIYKKEENKIILYLFNFFIKPEYFSRLLLEWNNYKKERI